MNCVICYEPIFDGVECAICHSKIHKECFREWQAANNNTVDSCPYCRNLLLDYDELDIIVRNTYLKHYVIKDTMNAAVVIGNMIKYMKHLKNENGDLLMPGYIYDIVNFPSMKYFRFDNQPCEYNYRLDLQNTDVESYNREMKNLHTLKKDIEPIIIHLMNGSFAAANIAISQLFTSIKLMNKDLVNELLIAVYNKDLDSIDEIKEVNIDEDKLRTVIMKIFDLRVNVKRELISTYEVRRMLKCHVCKSLLLVYPTGCWCRRCNVEICTECGMHHQHVCNSFSMEKFQKNEPICLFCFKSLKRKFDNFEYCDHCRIIYKRIERNNVLIAEEYKPTLDELHLIDQNDNYLMTCRHLLSPTTVADVARKVDAEKFILLLQSYYLDHKLLYPRLTYCVMKELPITIFSFTKEERLKLLLKPLLVIKYWDKIMDAIFKTSDENLESLLKLYDK